MTSLPMQTGKMPVSVVPVRKSSGQAMSRRVFRRLRKMGIATVLCSLLVILEGILSSTGFAQTAPQFIGSVSIVAAGHPGIGSEDVLGSQWM
jgi:NhaP-type Na+/H+ or K+/H+ antiporter